MLEIDLDRLIVRQTYFVPLEENQLMQASLTELNKSEKSYLNHKPWILKEEHGNCFAFWMSMGWLYVDWKTDHNPQTEQIRPLIEEYKNLGLQVEFEILSKLASDMPFVIYMRAEKSMEKGCEVEVECLPSLYAQLTHLEGLEVKKFMIQDAILNCRRFLRNIFVGGLHATPISEEKTKVPLSVAEFLINDITSNQIVDKLNELLQNATTEILIFGWVGTILLKKLTELRKKGIEIKVITGNVKRIRQDPMRKEKERAMKELISIIGKDRISIKPEFHGRAIVVDNQALIGSMDLDSYSLTGSRIEFATFTEDPEIVRSLRNYFNRIFVPWKKDNACMHT